jgi:Domain of unknown function (DUF1854)
MGPDGAVNDQAKPSFDLSHDAWGRLVLMGADGREHAGVEVVRGFPLSDPQHGIALCDADGHEILWIEDLDKLPPLLRKIIEEELARREFVPIIRRVVHVSAPVEPSEWEVETDRGQTRFLLNNEDDVHRLDEQRALITDARGIRYLIADTRQLDAVSRRLLERYL